MWIKWLWIKWKWRLLHPRTYIRGVGGRRVDTFVCKWFHRKDHACWDPLLIAYSDGTTLPGNECWTCNKCYRWWYKVTPDKLPPPTVIIGEYVSDGTFTNKENEDG